MAEGGGGGTRVLNDGGRQRFQVELRPGETTIVSWKKLVKDANRASASASAAAKPKEQPPVPKPPALHPRVDPGKTAEDDASDAPPASRFSAVIEKIERLYMGKNSSDEEDLNDVPDDDEYDTEDSFIDDAELDEYFQVDNSEIKHDGFFVNRGKLERMNEPITSPHEQQKKRKRKDMAKGLGGSDEGNTLNKHMAGKKAAGTSLPLTEKNSTYPTLVVALPTVNSEEMMVQNQSGSAGINVKKKSAIVKGSSLQSPLRVTNGEAVGEKGGKAKAGVLPAKNHGGKSKDGLFDMSNQMLIGNISSQGKPQYGRSLSSGEDVGQSAQQGEKNRIREHSDSIFSEGRNPMQATKVPHIQRKEVSSGKSKAVMLEKAIRELEKLVAESRPPSTEASDADNLAQTSKRRMPAEIKPKLAKIARLAHTTQGKLSKDLLNRLMSIVGHLIQLRTLKRNLKVLSEMGLSAKQERTSRFRQLKEEIHEMVKVRVPLTKSKALEQTGGASDDFQETVTADKEVLKRKFSMDDALEDKICELYDFYVEGLEEETGLHAHKLYGELVELWPKGFMDSHGIKRAISRAKDRKKAMNAVHKNQEKMRRKLSSKTDETRRSETNSVVKYAQGKLVSDSRATSTSVDKVVSVATTVDGTAKTTVVHCPNMDRPKQEKVKGNSNDMKTTEILAGKKQKNKPELVLSKCDVRPDKLISLEGEDKNTSH